MITIDEPTVPSRPRAELRTDVARRASRFRRAHRIRLAGTTTMAVALAALFFVASIPGTVTGVRTSTPASEGGGDDIRREAVEGTTPHDSAAPSAPSVGRGTKSHEDDPAYGLFPPPTVLPRQPDAPPTAEPLTKGKVSVLYARGSELHEIQVDGTGDRRVTDEPMYYGRFSPDRTTVVAVWDYDLVLVDAETGETSMLLESPSEFDSADRPAWMPDGRSILYHRTYYPNGLPGGVANELWQIDVATRTTRKFPIARNSGIPWAEIAVGPDGRILYHCPDTARICMTDQDGTDLGEIPGTENWWTYRWSPDGRWIASLGMASSSNALFVIRPDGSDRRLVFDHNFMGTPAWFPDGSRLLVSLYPPDPLPSTSQEEPPPCTQSPCPTDTGVWSVRFDGTDPRPVVSGRDNLILDARPSRN